MYIYIYIYLCRDSNLLPPLSLLRKGIPADHPSVKLVDMWKVESSDHLLSKVKQASDSNPHIEGVVIRKPKSLYMDPLSYLKVEVRANLESSLLIDLSIYPF